ncbi:MAG TPA: Uma2 family endonuclease [Pseudonocardiaceae bacterium]|nr:Uma2 family endonuclease [Pseudonocardiaceae bacterium]
MTAKALPDWFLPPPDGWHSGDLDRLPPEAPRHIELIDGTLVVHCPQTVWHSKLISALFVWLAAQAPDGLEVMTRMTVWLGDRQRLEPDVLVIDGAAAVDLSRTWFRPDEVHLVIEVVSPESETRDTRRKPQLYAEAGIRHFWRVDNDGGHAVVFAFELDPGSRSYAPVGVFRETMKLAAPFPIEMRVDTLDQWHPLSLS